MLTKLRILLAAFLLGASAVQAQSGTAYLFFPDGQTTTSTVYYGAAPSNGGTAVPFIPVNGDTNPNDYQYVNGTLGLIPPPAPVVTAPVADAQGLCNAIVNDRAVFSGAEKLELAPYFPLLQTYANAQNPPGTPAGTPTPLQAIWYNMVLVYGSTWLTTDLQTRVVNYAVPFNVMLAIPAISPENKRVK